MATRTLADSERASRLERLVFFGTPAFAVPTLEALHAAGRTPKLVVSQPTRQVGRGRRRVAPPVAQWAERHDVELIQTDRVRSSDFLARLEELEPCLAVVVAFGQIFRRPLLELPRFGCLNLHASLLPAYRGASPIVAAIRHGERTTGVSTMVMERGLDSGPVLMQRDLAIGPLETAGELAPRLARLGAGLVVETLERFEQGELRANDQDDESATHAPMLERGEGELDWRLPAQALHDLVRAFDPWPGTRTIFRGRPLVVKRTVPPAALEAELPDRGRPGAVLGTEQGVLWVAAGDGRPLGIVEVQRPGRRSITAADFINGERPEHGEYFGQALEDDDG